jgi:hypothetical protein
MSMIDSRSAERKTSFDSYCDELNSIYLMIWGLLMNYECILGLQEMGSSYHGEHD